MCRKGRKTPSLFLDPLIPREVEHMTRIRVLVGVLAVALFTGGWLLGQEKKDVPKLKVTLPQGWAKLGLSAEQKDKVYKTRAEYKAKIDALRKQIDQLAEEEKVELSKILTDEQRAQLRKLVAPDPPKDKK
jgi:hypothetical protein